MPATAKPEVPVPGTAMREIPPATVAAYAEAAAPLLGLAVDPAWRDGVAAHLATILAAAERVAAFPLPDELEAAPVFRPVPASRPLPAPPRGDAAEPGAAS